MPARGRDFGGVFYAQAPACGIDLVNALIAQVAIAVVPHPMPVVMKPVGGEFVLRRRPLPEIVVDTGGDRLRGLGANGVAALEAEAASHVDVTDQTFTDFPDGFAAHRGALLGSVLHH